MTKTNGDYTLTRDTFVAKPLAPVFDFFSRAENLEKLTPAWLNFHILTPQPIEMREGAQIAYKLRVRGLPMKWVSEIQLWRPPFEFVDLQLKGPYRLWRHTHRFSEAEGGTRIEDRVEYALPFGAIGRLVHNLLVKRDLAMIFAYREQQVRRLLG